MPWHGWDGWWHMGFMWLFWSLVIVLIVWLIVRAPGRGLPTGDHETPEQILKRRYARGEVEKEEYERRLSDLRR